MTTTMISVPWITCAQFWSTPFRIRIVFTSVTTNAAAMEAAAGGAPEGSVFVAEEQTAGRGRAGHSWESAQSLGIYCSVVLRPALPPAEALVLSLAAGLAVQSPVGRPQGSAPRRDIAPGSRSPRQRPR